MSDTDKIIEHLHKELAAIRTDRPSPSLLDNVRVSAYGQESPLKSLAQVTVDGRNLVVSVYDFQTASAVDKAIRTSGLGFNPIVNGSTLVLPVPPLTEDRRKELCVLVRRHGETAKIAVRAVRKKMIDDAEDPNSAVFKGRKNKIEDMIKRVITRIDDIVKSKESDILV